MTIYELKDVATSRYSDIIDTLIRLNTNDHLEFEISSPFLESGLVTRELYVYVGIYDEPSIYLETFTIRTNEEYYEQD